MQNTLLSQANIEEILVPSGHVHASSLTRRDLMDWLSNVSPTIDTNHTMQVFLDFVGDSRVAVVYDRYTRTVRVHWMEAGPNFSMRSTTWDYSLDRPKGFLNTSLSYVGL